MKKISKELKAWRARNKCSQAEAAERLGVSVRTLQDWEQARRQPNGLSMAALLDRMKAAK